MDITLIFAKASLRRGTLIKHYMLPPHGLQILAALTPPDHRVQIIDEYHHLANPHLCADLVGISVWTAASQRAYALADHYRQRGLRVVLGGPHVTVCPDEAATHADSIVVGEAEPVWAALLQDAQAGSLRPRYEGPLLPLDETPTPDWSTQPSGDYTLQAALSTTRGCPRGCDFCFESCRPKPNFRQRSLEKVLADIDARPEGVIAFLDNDITVNRRFARSLFSALIPRQRSWLGMTSIEVADDPEMLDLLARSGCRSLFVGFESVNPASLGEVHKGCNQVENYIRNVTRIHERDIMVNGSFVFGFDHDTPQVFEQTVKFGIAARLDTATFTVLTPYPGTTLYKRLDAEGRIFDRDWSHYDTTRAVFQPRGMTVQELEQGYFQAYRSFYSWNSMMTRARLQETGWPQRMFLNIAYKKVEPLYRFLEMGLPVGKLRWLFNWYARRHPNPTSSFFTGECAQHSPK